MSNNTKPLLRGNLVAKVSGAVEKQEPRVKVSELLKFVLEMRYVTPVQIQKQFFKDDATEGLRLAKELIFSLRYEGKVRIWKSSELNDDSWVLVTEDGRNQLVLENPGKVIPNLTKAIFQPRMKHDMLLNELRIRFEEINFIEKWVSDAHMAEMGAILRNFEKDRPDAICKKKDGFSYFLELEVSEKGPKQYRERMEHYLKVLALDEFKDQKITGVIFFCKNESVQKKIKSLIPEGAKGISVMPYDKYFLTKEERKAINIANEKNAAVRKEKVASLKPAAIPSSGTAEPVPTDIFNL